MPKVMRITAIRETFPDEWVAVEVTKVDKADVPLAGIILTHGFDKGPIYQAVKIYLAQHPAARIFVFFTSDPIPENIEVALALR